jgi:hypothetical protein
MPSEDATGIIIEISLSSRAQSRELLFTIRIETAGSSTSFRMTVLLFCDREI